MKREEINREGISGLWILTDSEMFRLSMYATEAEKRYKKQGAKALSAEAKGMAKEIDSILKDTDFYKSLTAALDNVKI